MGEDDLDATDISVESHMGAHVNTLNAKFQKKEFSTPIIYWNIQRFDRR